MVVCCLFSKDSFRNTIRVSNILDPDQDRHSVGPDLGPNCLQNLSEDNQTNFSCFCCCLLPFFKMNFFQNILFRNTIRVSNGLDPDQDRHSVDHDQPPNCLQRLSEENQTNFSCFCRPPDKSAHWKIIFFISHPKHMLWVLKRTVSMKPFF